MCRDNINTSNFHNFYRFTELFDENMFYDNEELNYISYDEIINFIDHKIYDFYEKYGI